jgi:hypothetical protein
MVIEAYRSEIADAQQDYDGCGNNDRRAEIGEWISSFRGSLRALEEGVEKVIDRYDF